MANLSSPPTFFVGDTQDMGAILVLVVAVGFAGYLLGRSPQNVRPGMSIALLGVVALLATVFPTADVFQRVVVLLVGIGLITLEIWFIAADGARRDQAVATMIDHLEAIRRQPIVEAEVSVPAEIATTGVKTPTASETKRIELYRQANNVAKEIVKFVKERTDIRPATIPGQIDSFIRGATWTLENVALFKEQLSPKIIKLLRELEAHGLGELKDREMSEGNLGLNGMLNLAERLNALGRQLLEQSD